MLSSKCLSLALMALLAAACTGVPTARQPGKPAAPQMASRPSGATIGFHIDAAHSELRVLVYRGGPLADFGHNHVILDRALAGWIRFGTSIPDSSFYLRLAPAGFLVDEPQARAQAGPDFADEVADDARSGTRHNMLSPAQLDADRFPLIDVESVSLQGSEPAAAATMKITVAGRATTLTLPFTLERESEGLRVTADFNLRQSTVGLAPVSLLLGALRVEDEMRLTLTIFAVAD